MSLARTWARLGRTPVRVGPQQARATRCAFSAAQRIQWGRSLPPLSSRVTNTKARPQITAITFLVLALGSRNTSEPDAHIFFRWHAVPAIRQRVDAGSPDDDRSASSIRRSEISNAGAAIYLWESLPGVPAPPTQRHPPHARLAARRHRVAVLHEDKVVLLGVGRPF